MDLTTLIDHYLLVDQPPLLLLVELFLEVFMFHLQAIELLLTHIWLSLKILQVLNDLRAFHVDVSFLWFLLDFYAATLSTRHDL